MIVFNETDHRDRNHQVLLTLLMRRSQRQMNVGSEANQQHLTVYKAC